MIINPLLFGLALLVLLVIWILIKVSKEEETFPQEIVSEMVEIRHQQNGKLIGKTGTVRKR
jgi:hypothetical protein